MVENKTHNYPWEHLVVVACMNAYSSLLQIGKMYMGHNAATACFTGVMSLV